MSRWLLALLVFLPWPTALAQVTSLHALNACCGHGWAVADLRDIDGDGKTDLIVGANESGQVYVYSGRTGTLLRTFTLAGTDLGYAVAQAGDVDGDGTFDILAGSPNAGGTGAIRVYSGRTGAELLAVSGPSAQSGFGEALSGAGDLDGDGRGDLWVGAGNVRSVFLVSGRDGSVLRTLAQPGSSRFGAGVSRVRDLDGDGRDELLAAAPKDLPGKAYVYAGSEDRVLFTVASDAGGSEFGTFFVADAGDVDDDGTTDLFVGDPAASGGSGAAYVYSGRGGARLHKFTGTAREGMGTGRGAGDVDGDGHADLAVGSYTYSGAGITRAGRVSVFSGRTGEALVRYDGATAEGNFGYDTVGMGDLDGDRRQDLVVSSAPLNRVDLVAGTVASAAPAFSIVQGVSGAWYNPATSGQGYLFDVRPSDRFFFAALFTYPQAATPAPKLGSADQRWLTLQGTYADARATLSIFQTSGGAFDAARATSTTQVGSASVEFESCTRAIVTYSLPQDGLAGTQVLQRLLPGTESACIAQQAAR